MRIYNFDKISPLTILFLTLFFFLATMGNSKAAESFDFTQHNVKLQSGNYAIGYRDHKNKDKWHLEPSVKFDKWAIAYRYAKSKGKLENRLRITHSGVKKNGFGIKPRMEVRNFSDTTKDDFSNLWLMVSYKKSFGKFTPYIEICPKFAFASDKYDNGSHYETESEMGVMYKVSDSLSVGGLFEIITDKSNHTKAQFLGTNLKLKF